MSSSGTLDLFAIVRKEGGLYVSSCPEFDVASQGLTVEEALKNLKEALELYLEDADVEKPLEVEAPMVTVVKVGLSDVGAKGVAGKS